MTISRFFVSAALVASFLQCEKTYPELSLSGVWIMTDNAAMGKFLGIETPPGGSYCMHLDEFARKGRIRFVENAAAYTVRFQPASRTIHEGMSLHLVYQDRMRQGHVEVREGIERRLLIYLYFDDTREKRERYDSYNGIRSPGDFDQAGIEACVNELQREYETDLQTEPNEPGDPQ